MESWRWPWQYKQNYCVSHPPLKLAFWPLSEPLRFSLKSSRSVSRLCTEVWNAVKSRTVELAEFSEWTHPSQYHLPDPLCTLNFKAKSWNCQCVELCAELENISVSSWAVTSSKLVCESVSSTWWLCHIRILINLSNSVEPLVKEGFTPPQTPQEIKEILWSVGHELYTQWTLWKTSQLLGWRVLNHLKSDSQHRRQLWRTSRTFSVCTPHSHWVTLH